MNFVRFHSGFVSAPDLQSGEGGLQATRKEPHQKLTGALAPKAIRGLFVLVAIFLFAALPSSAKISYTISLASPGQHRFHVTMAVAPAANQPDVTVALPAWNALYQVRDFAYRIVDLRANEPAKEAIQLKMSALDKDTWRLIPNYRLAGHAVQRRHQLRDPMGRPRPVQFAVE
jgi:hypothetical protein